MTNEGRERLAPIRPRTAAVLAFALPFILYAATLAPGLLNDDPGEYQLIVGALGVAHPTGYPLYTLLGHVFTKLLPFGEIAWRVNLFSGVVGALACLMLFALLRELGSASVIALLATLLFSIGADTWYYATVAQTYALNSLLITLTLWAFVRWQKRRDVRSFAVLGLAAGLGTAHHSTFWLVLPGLSLGVLCVLIGQRRARTRLEVVGGWRGLVAAAILFLAPLSLYLYIPIRGEQLLAAMPGDVLGVPQAVVSGMLTPHYLPGWTNVVLGSFYAGSTLEGAAVDWTGVLGRYAISLLSNIGGLAVLGGGIALTGMWRRYSVVLLLLVVAWLTNLVVVTRGVAAFSEPVGGLYTPTLIFGTVLAALVGQRLFEATNSTRRFYIAASVFSVLSAAVAFAVGAAAFGNVVRIFYPERPLSAGFNSYREWARELLSRDLAPNAVVLGNWAQVTPLHYTQQINGLRKEVAVIQAPLASAEGRAFATKALAAGIPLYLLEPDYEVLSVSAEQPPPDAIRIRRTFGDLIALEGYRAGTPTRDDSGEAVRRLHLYFRLVGQPDADYKIFVRCVRASEPEGCSPDRHLGGEYWHSSLWQKDRVVEHQAIVWDFRGEIEIGIYHPDTLKRLQLPDGSTTVRLTWQ